MHTFIYFILFFSLITNPSKVFSQATKKSESTISFFLDISEGGSDSIRNIKKLQNYLSENRCEVQVTTVKPSEINIQEARRFYFKALRNKEHNQSQVESLLQAKTYSGKTISPAVVVRRNTATHLNAINKMPVSLVKTGAKSGDLTSGELKKFASDAQLKKLESGNHMGALSLLLHKDAFAAVIDFGFASQWLEKNNLNVISKGNTQEAGGIFFNKNARLWLQEQKMLGICISAFTQLDRNNRKDNRVMQVFPDWLVRFE